MRFKVYHPNKNIYLNNRVPNYHVSYRYHYGHRIRCISMFLYGIIIKKLPTIKCVPTTYCYSFYIIIYYRFKSKMTSKIYLTFMQFCL